MRGEGLEGQLFGEGVGARGTGSWGEGAVGRKGGDKLGE